VDQILIRLTSPLSAAAFPWTVTLTRREKAWPLQSSHSASRQGGFTQPIEAMHADNEGTCTGSERSVTLLGRPHEGNGHALQEIAHKWLSSPFKPHFQVRD